MTEPDPKYTRPVQGIFFSTGWGHGKTVALVSFRRPGETPRRLIIDNERRARSYKSANGRDKPSRLLYAFDYFHAVYEEQMEDGEWTPDALSALYEDIKSSKFKYNALLLDNAAMLQEDLVGMVKDSGKAVAIDLTQRFRGVYNKHSRFLEYKFKPSSAVDIYGIVKSILGEILRVCQRQNIDVLTATDGKNVWYKYGTRDMKILGQSAKILAPFMKYADFVYRLSRLTGNRDLGTAKLVAVPWTHLDTFNPKNSLPGLKPQFEFTWPGFWELVASRGVTTQKDLDKIKVEESEIPESTGDPARDLEIAKAKWISAAEEVGLTKGKNDAKGMTRLIELLAEHELSSDDAGDPVRFRQGLEIITGAALHASEKDTSTDKGKK